MYRLAIIIIIIIIITRSSATAERQLVSYTHLSRLAHWSCISLNTASVLQLYNRLAKLVSTLSYQTVRHTHVKLNRAFKVIPGHPCWRRQKSRMVRVRNVHLMPMLFLKRTKIWQTGKRQIRRFQRPHSGLTPLHQKTPSNIYKWLILSESRVIDLYFCRWQYWSMFTTFHAIIFKSWTIWV